MLNNLFSKHTFLKLKEHKLFQSIVIVAIILSAFLVGASTFKISDTLIVFISIIPIGPNSSILVFRLLRIFRVLRLISAVPELKELIEALLLSVKRVFYVSLLLFIILYIYASFGSILFSEADPERWRDMGVSMITLVQVLTLSSWEQVMLPMQQLFWWSWIYFFSFIAIGSITVLNLIIAVLVDVVTNQKKINK